MGNESGPELSVGWKIFCDGVPVAGNKAPPGLITAGVRGVSKVKSATYTGMIGYIMYIIRHYDKTGVKTTK